MRSVKLVFFPFAALMATATFCKVLVMDKNYVVARPYSSFELRCLSESGASRIRWNLPDRHLGMVAAYVSFDDKTSMLKVFAAEPSASGIYSCFVELYDRESRNWTTTSARASVIVADSYVMEPVEEETLPISRGTRYFRYLRTLRSSKPYGAETAKDRLSYKACYTVSEHPYEDGDYGFDGRTWTCASGTISVTSFKSQRPRKSHSCIVRHDLSVCCVVPDDPCRRERPARVAILTTDAVTVVVGQTFSLLCQFPEPTAGVSWVIPDPSAVADRPSTFRSASCRSNKTHLLRVLSASKWDEGLYSCRGSSGGYQSSTKYVHVTKVAEKEERSPTVRFDFLCQENSVEEEEEEEEENEEKKSSVPVDLYKRLPVMISPEVQISFLLGMIALRCTTERSVESVRWLVNGRDVTKEDNVYPTSCDDGHEHTLTVIKVTIKQQGAYVCMTDDGSFAEAKVKVLGDSSSPSLRFRHLVDVCKDSKHGERTPPVDFSIGPLHYCYYFDKRVNNFDRPGTCYDNALSVRVNSGSCENLPSEPVFNDANHACSDYTRKMGFVFMARESPMHFGDRFSFNYYHVTPIHEESFQVYYWAVSADPRTRYNASRFNGDDVISSGIELGNGKIRRLVRLEIDPALLTRKTCAEGRLVVYRLNTHHRSFYDLPLPCSLRVIFTAHNITVTKDMDLIARQLNRNLHVSDMCSDEWTKFGTYDLNYPSSSSSFSPSSSSSSSSSSSNLPDGNDELNVRLVNFYEYWNLPETTAAHNSSDVLYLLGVPRFADVKWKVNGERLWLVRPGCDDDVRLTVYTYDNYRVILLPVGEGAIRISAAVKHELRVVKAVRTVAMPSRRWYVPYIMFPEQKIFDRPYHFGRSKHERAYYLPRQNSETVFFAN